MTTTILTTHMMIMVNFATHHNTDLDELYIQVFVIYQIMYLYA